MARYSRAVALYTNLVEANIPTSDEEANESDGHVEIHANESEDDFPEARRGAGRPSRVSAAARFAHSGMNQAPLDRRPQLDFGVIQGDLSQVNTENLAGAVTQKSGKTISISTDWLGKVNGLGDPDQTKSVSFKQLPDGAVVTPAGPDANLGQQPVGSNQGGVALSDLGLTEHLS